MLFSCDVNHFKRLLLIWSSLLFCLRKLILLGLDWPSTNTPVPWPLISRIRRRRSIPSIIYGSESPAASPAGSGYADLWGFLEIKFRRLQRALLDFSHSFCLNKLSIKCHRPGQIVINHNSVNYGIVRISNREDWKNLNCSYSLLKLYNLVAWIPQLN